MNARTLQRRELLRGGLLAGTLGAIWAPARAVATSADDGAPPVASFDVACLGGTFAPNFATAIEPDTGDMRGASFSVEGLLYPAGTIPEGDGFDPASVEAAGHWFCRGWFITHPDRPLPHVITTQEYLLGRISDGHPAPADQLVSSGVEGGVDQVVRSVVGGTGRYRHARGEIVQRVTGTNSTTLRIVNEPAPNFRFSVRP